MTAIQETLHCRVSLTWSGTRNKSASMKKRKQEQGKKTICKGQEDHGDMETDINETEMQEMEDETRGPGTNGGVSEM